MLLITGISLTVTLPLRTPEVLATLELFIQTIWQFKIYHVPYEYKLIKFFINSSYRSIEDF